MMRALLLAAGFGMRLRPLTDTLPKCLVPIKGRPLLGLWLQRLRETEVGPILINTHYLSGLVDAFIATSPYRDSVSVVYEDELKGTAGTLIGNLEFFGGEDAMLIHADNYCLADLSAFVAAHRSRPRGCAMTMMTFRSPTPRSCGIVERNANGVVTAFYEKVPNPPGDIANCGVYIISREMMEQLSDEFESARDFSTQIIPNFLGKIYSYHTSETFMDIGTPETYAAANRQ